VRFDSKNGTGIRGEFADFPCRQRLNKFQEPTKQLFTAFLLLGEICGKHRSPGKYSTADMLQKEWPETQTLAAFPKLGSELYTSDVVGPKKHDNVTGW